MSMYMHLSALRPPLSCIPRQFLNGVLTRVYGGIIVRVLSQLRTLTVFRVISSTVPFAVPSGIWIQSPRRTILFCASCTPATNPSMLSLNMSISTAADAPRPVSRTAGDLSMTTETMIMPPIKYMTTFRACTTPWSGCVLCLSVLLYMSRAVESSALQIIMTTMSRYTTSMRCNTLTMSLLRPNPIHPSI